MSVTADLFIGVVTHPGTRFAESSTPRGLAASLADRLASRGLTAEVSIHGEDAWTPTLLPIDDAEIKKSIVAELDAEARWRLFQSPRTPRMAMTAFMTLRRTYRRRTFLPKGTVVDDRHPGYRMVRRLANIELAHLALLRQARDAGARWALILEDDATAEADQAAEVLAQLLRKADDLDQPLYVNVSRSFDEQRLRIEGHLTDIGGIKTGAEEIRILSAERPVTNTVCAVLYRGSFLPSLLDAMDAIPLSPVIPIDWKLNTALLDLSDAQRLQAGDCWTLRPAPIVQGSMHTES